MYWIVRARCKSRHRSALCTGSQTTCFLASIRRSKLHDHSLSMYVSRNSTRLIHKYCTIFSVILALVSLVSANSQTFWLILFRFQSLAMHCSCSTVPYITNLFCTSVVHPAYHTVCQKSIYAILDKNSMKNSEWFAKKKKSGSFFLSTFFNYYPCWICTCCSIFCLFMQC